MGVRDFEAIVERLSPAMRAAFEAERAARWAELERFYVEGGGVYHSPTANLARGIGQAPEALVRRVWLERFVRKVGQFRIPELIANFFPRIAAHEYYRNRFFAKGHCWFHPTRIDRSALLRILHEWSLHRPYGAPLE